MFCCPRKDRLNENGHATNLLAHPTLFRHCFDGVPRSTLPSRAPARVDPFISRFVDCTVDSLPLTGADLLLRPRRPSVRPSASRSFLCRPSSCRRARPVIHPFSSLPFFRPDSDVKRSLGARAVGEGEESFVHNACFRVHCRRVITSPYLRLALSLLF